MDVWEQYRHEKRHLRPLLTTARVRRGIWIPAGQIEKRKLVKRNFSFSASQSLELMRAWVVDTGLVPQVENKHNENQWLCLTFNLTSIWRKKQSKLITSKPTITSRWRGETTQKATIHGEYSHHLGTGSNFTNRWYFFDKERWGARGLPQPQEEDEAREADGGGAQHPGQGDPHHGGDRQPRQGGDGRVQHPSLPDQDGQLKELKIVSEY